MRMTRKEFLKKAGAGIAGFVAADAFGADAAPPARAGKTLRTRVLGRTGIRTTALGFGAAAYRNWFRFYTIGTILTLFLTGLMAFLYAPEVGANLPTPWLGLTERISTYV